ncbi:MAG: SRPBCC domain-containing protein [Alphaproteobacteria bacterium]|nr:SRPBCC domain-containing protein [Alphaproteobacteria bacterium]
MIPHLPGKTDYHTPDDVTLVATRRFAAPRAQVWAAWTEPTLLRRWLLGPEGWTMPVCEVDLRAGGAQRFVWARAGREDMEITGTYVEVEPPGRLVFDESWGGGWPVTRNTLELFEDAAGTVMVMTTVWPDAEAARKAQGTGMKGGSDLSFGRLDEWFRPGIELPRVQELAAQPAAVIHLTVRPQDMERAMDPAVQELLAALGEQGLGPVGPMFTRHLRVTPGQFDFDLGFPASAPVTPTGRVQAGERPALRALSTVYRGPYEGLPKAWATLNAWARVEGLGLTGGVLEVYTRGPESSPDPADWQTELHHDLA